MHSTIEGLRYALTEWHEFVIPRLTPRSLDWALLDDSRITAIIGPRRAGKTWACFQAIGRILDRGVPRTNVVYVNFEDERLRPCTGTELTELLTTQAELYAPDRAHPRYFFLDEIHNVPRWSQWVRRATDQNLDVRIVLTGSSSRLLSTEIATELRGRASVLTVYPYSFAEFLSAREQAVPAVTEALLRSPHRADIRRTFNDYTQRGGFPEIALRERFREPLQQYYRAMFTRDMVDRFAIRNVRQFEDFLSIQLSRFAALSSVHNIEKTMKGLGYSLSKSTLMSYLRFAADAFLLFEAPRFDRKVSIQLRHPRKVYAVDHGLVNAIRFSTSEDRGRILENVAFMELRRRHPTLFYHAGAAECDFVVFNGRKVTHCYQVCWSLQDPTTAEREYRGLVDAARTYGLSEGTILCDTEHGTLTRDGVRIRILPMWYFALRPSHD